MNRDSLRILHAGALRGPLKECVRIFRQANPDIEGRPAIPTWPGPSLTWCTDVQGRQFWITTG